MKRSRLFKSFIRKFVIPLVILTVISVLIVAGINVSMKRQLSSMLLSQTESYSSQIADWLHKERLQRTESPNTQSALIDIMSDLSPSDLPGSVVQYVLFDPYGRPVFDSGAATPRLAETADINEDARSVIASGMPRSFLERTEGPDGEAWLTEAYVPVYDRFDRVAGAIEIYLDMTEPYTLHANAFGVIRDVVTWLALILYAVPSLALFYQTEKRRQREEAVHRLSRFDMLTGVQNRAAVTENLQTLFEHEHGTCGVICLDVDSFSKVNERFGHDIGDAYLKEITQKFRALLREEDVIGRTGGDEFIAVIKNVEKEHLVSVSERLIEAAREPIRWKHWSIRGTVSIGAHLADEKDTALSAVGSAEVALQNAKQSGKDRFVIYSEGLDAALKRRKLVERALYRAIDQKSAEVAFQPLISADTHQAVGFEALARLRDEEGTPISPAEFVPMAEDSGLIVAFGEEVLRSALNHLRSWPTHVTVAVNLSPVQFSKGDIVKTVKRALSEFDVAPQQLELEVTESLLLEDEACVAEQLVALRDAGVRIAMDDFGTGYSSMGYLWRYPFDKLKIDRIFLENYDYDQARQRDIIETIVILGHKLGMRVTVEGVETETHLEMLRPLRPDQYQGYYFSKPMTPKVAKAYIYKKATTEYVA